MLRFLFVEMSDNTEVQPQGKMLSFKSHLVQIPKLSTLVSWEALPEIHALGT